MLCEIEFLLLYLSVTRSVIGQFCGPYFAVRPAKLQLVSFPKRPINLSFLGPYCKLRILSFLRTEKTRLVRGM